MLYGEFAEIILEVLRNTLSPLQSYTGVPFLTNVADVNGGYLHEPNSSNYRNLIELGEY